ncbi:MAG TPA: amino acid adenylation domain-containing protein [Verrucomicrobiae bacterium]|nr:amino acid adenylation domain-containing protein [Verrucomicrobiae bacterium]
MPSAKALEKSAQKQIYPEHLCIHQLFEQQVQRTPDAIAIAGAQNQYTYAQLNAQANQLARYLQSRGVGPETVVGCYLTRSSAIVLYMLAILKAGGIYLLLDPHLPARRLHYLVENAGPLLILADASLPASVQKIAPDVILVDEVQKSLHTLETSNVSSQVQPQNAAYIAYTSGSTGRPKGVIITHQATVNHSYDFAKRFRLTPRDRVPLMAPIAFDMATEEIIPPLMAGCTLVVSASQHTDMPAFTAEIIKEGYTILNVPAPLWRNWTEYLVDYQLAVPPSLRLVIVGSDKIYTKHFLEWKGLEGTSDVAWVAAYGTTETTVTSTFYTTAHQDDLSQEPTIPIGKPIANTTLYALDDDGQPVQPGEIGELYIGGHGLARGYHKLDDTTRDRFLPNPFSDEPDARMYKTGDQARMWPDGTVVCLGRKDLQVKLNGLRIELGEIEAILAEHPAVDEAVVVLRHTADGKDDHLVAFVTLRSGHDFGPEHLQTFASDRLHRHMVPRHFVRLVDLPVAATGKLDRKTLEGYTKDEMITYV